MLGKRIPPDESVGGRPQLARPVSPSPPPPSAPADGFVVRPPRYTPADLVLPPAVREQFDLLLSRLRHHDLIYREWGMAAVDPTGRSRAVNFYGPPGTGKTMCAEALASALGCDVLEVSYAEVESRYVGDTPKKIEAVFRAAEGAGRPVLLFFDEADAILGRRMTDVTQAADHSVNVSRAVMLTRLNSFDGVVAFATNLADNFDPAFVRRILQHIPVPPPDADGRRALWRRLVPPAVPGRERVDWDALAAASDGLTGGDIRNAAVLALAAAAARTGDERAVRTADLEAAAASVLRAKREVGGSRLGG